MLSLRYLLFLSFFHFLGFSLLAECPNTQRCTFEHIVSSDYVVDMEQIGDVLYLATSGGLIAYDTSNESHLHYTTNEGLRSNDVRALAADSRGVLWIATNEGLCRFADDCFFHESEPEDDSPYRVWIDDMLVDQQDRLWLSNAVWSGCVLMWYDEENEESGILKACDGIPETAEILPRALKLDATGNIWMISDTVNAIGPLNRRLSYFNPETLQESIVIDTLTAQNWAVNMQFEGQSALWFSNHHQIYRYDLLEGSTDFVYQSPYQWIDDLAILEDGSFWFTMPYDTKLYNQSIENAINLDETPVAALFQDQGTIYVATDQGLWSVTGSETFTEFLPSFSEVKSNNVSDISSDDFGNAWIAYRSSLQYPLAKYHKATGEIQHFAFDNLRSLDRISLDGTQVYAHNGNTIYKGNQEGNFSKIELNFEAQALFYSSNILVQETRIIVAASTLQDGEESYHLMAIEDTELSMLGTADASIHSLAIGNAGEIYAATKNGLYRYDESSFLLLIPEINIIDMGYNVNEADLWLTRADVQWYENSLYRFSEAEGLWAADHDINQAGLLDLNSSGSMWVSARGIQRSDGQSNISGPFQLVDGLPMSFINCLHVDEEENVFVGTEAGLAIIKDRDFIGASDTQICPGQSIDFSTELAEDLQWKIKIYNTIIDSFSTPNFSYQFDQSGKYLVILDALLDDCLQTDVQSIDVYELATQLGLQDSYALCTEGDSVLLNTGYGMMSYEWSYEGQVMSTNHEVFTSEIGEYELTVQDYCGNSNTLSTTVEESLSVDLFVDCEEAGQQLSISSSTLYEEQASYLWSTGETTASISTNESGVYSVEVTLNGCTDTESISVELPCVVVKTEEIKPTKIEIFPNPASFLINIKTDAPIEELILHDATGHLQQSPYDQKQIDVSALQSGWYLLSLKVDGQWHRHKFLK